MTQRAGGFDRGPGAGSVITGPMPVVRAHAVRGGGGAGDAFPAGGMGIHPLRLVRSAPKSGVRADGSLRAGQGARAKVEVFQL